jgi:MFS transporter, ACS family, aldohexuronate transporter
LFSQKTLRTPFQHGSQCLHKKFLCLDDRGSFLHRVGDQLPGPCGFGCGDAQIRRDLSLSNSNYSLTVNSFLVLYMVFYVLGGRVVDRFGYSRTFTVSVIFWSIANMLHGMARGLGSLCFFRALLGIGEGAYYPTAIRGLSEWFAPENRAKAVGVLLCGVSVGSLVTPPVVAWITIHFGWRASFLFTGALGFLLVLLWLYLNRIIRRTFGDLEHSTFGTKASEERAVDEKPLPLPEVLKRRKYWFLLTARAVTDATWLFYVFWLPGYFQVIRGFSLIEVGRWLWIPFFFADIGALVGAWASSALIQRGYALDPSRKIVLVVSAFLGLFGIGTYYVFDQALAIAFISLALFGHFSWASNIHTVITEVIPKQHVAMLYGITGAAGTGLGVISQYIVGQIVDMKGYEIPFVCASAAYVLAIALLLFAGKIGPMRVEAKQVISVSNDLVTP